MQITDKDFIKKYASVVVKAWDDESFKKKLISDPVKFLKGEDIQFPEGLSVTVSDGETKQSYDCVSNKLILPLPAKPKNATLLKDGDTTFSACCCCCCCP